MASVTMTPGPASASASEITPSPLERHHFEWFGTGRALLKAQLEAISQAVRMVRLETYIFSESEIGDRFRDELISAARRGVEVRLLVDALGSFELRRDYFRDLEAEPAASFRWFNPMRLTTLSFRDHRKVLVVDDAVAFVGGANIGDEYCGDGVEEGWRDGGVSLRGPALELIAAEFDAQFERASERRWKLRQSQNRRLPSGADVDVLFLRPGFGHNPFRASLRRDLRLASQVDIVCAYFLPSLSLRRHLTGVTQRGGSVRLLLAGKSDVRLMQLAARSTYRDFLRRRIDIFEYEPQILHAKLYIIDDIVYIGSANLDPRSLRINFEVMLRIHDRTLAQMARRQFELDLEHSTKVTPDCLENRRSWWAGCQQKGAYWVLARLDPMVAEMKLRRWVRAAVKRRQQKKTAG